MAYYPKRQIYAPYNNSLYFPPAAFYASNDASGFASAALQVKQSSASVPSPRWYEWLFDATTDEYICTQFIAGPEFMGGGPAFRIHYKMTSATSGTVYWGYQIKGIAPGSSTDIDSLSFCASGSTSQTVPGTAGYASYLDLYAGLSALSCEINPGDHVFLAIYRDADVDSATGDAEFLGLEILY